MADEVRLIDAGKLIGYLHEKTFIDGDDRSMVYKAIEEQPTVEVEPVKYGRWIDFPECLEYEGALDCEDFVCSECHHVWNTIDNCAETFKCCPNCGSKNEGAEKFKYYPSCGSKNEDGDSE